MRTPKDLELLSLIAKNTDLTCSDLAISREVTAGAIWQQLRHLQKINLIKWDGITRAKNKKKFIIDYDALTNHFINFCLREINDKIDKMPKDFLPQNFDKKESELVVSNKDLLKNIIKKILLQNPIEKSLKQLWYNLFLIFGSLKNPYTPKKEGSLALLEAFAFWVAF